MIFEWMVTHSSDTFSDLQKNSNILYENFPLNAITDPNLFLNNFLKKSLDRLNF